MQDWWGCYFVCFCGARATFGWPSDFMRPGIGARPIFMAWRIADKLRWGTYSMRALPGRNGSPAARWAQRVATSALPCSSYFYWPFQLRCARQNIRTRSLSPKGTTRPPLSGYLRSIAQAAPELEKLML